MALSAPTCYTICQGREERNERGITDDVKRRDERMLEVKTAAFPKPALPGKVLNSRRLPARVRAPT